MTLRDRIIYYFEKIPQTKENDNLLIAYIVRDLYGVQNTFDIALTTKANIYESIRRERAKLQQDNKEYLPTEDCQKARMKKEDIMHDKYSSYGNMV